MQRTIHEVLELRDLIVACDTAANQLRHAASTVRDADVIQMLGAHERTFRHQCQQLQRFLTGTAVDDPGPTPAPGATGNRESAPALGYGPSAPADAVIMLHSPPGGNGQPGRPVHPGEAGGAPGYPPTGPGTYSDRPAARSGYGAGLGAHGSPGDVGRPPSGPRHFPPIRGGSPEGDESRRGDTTVGSDRQAAGRRPGAPDRPGSATRRMDPAARREGDPGTGPASVINTSGAAQLESGRGQVVRADRPELVGWEPGAGNNEGWQSAARHGSETPRLEAAETFEAVRPVGIGSGPYSFGGLGALAGTHPAGVVLGLASAGLPPESGQREQEPLAPQPLFRPEAPAGPGDRSRWARQRPGGDRQAGVKPGAPAAGGAGGRARQGETTAGSPGQVSPGSRWADSPRVGFAQEWTPAVPSPASAPSTFPAPGGAHGAPSPATAGGSGVQPVGAPFSPPGATGPDGSLRPSSQAGWSAPATGPRPPVTGQGFGAPAPASAAASMATEPAPAAAASPSETGPGVAIQDPDALAVASCLQNCKHMATRMVMAAAESADRHLRRALYQMAGQHLEMAGQQWEWLRRRGLYDAPPAAPDLVAALQSDLARMAQALHVGPAVSPGTAAGAVSPASPASGGPGAGGTSASTAWGPGHP